MKKIGFEILVNYETYFYLKFLIMLSLYLFTYLFGISFLLYFSYLFTAKRSKSMRKD